MDSLLGNGDDLGNGSGPPLGRTVSDAQRGSVGKRVAGKAKGTIIAAADSRESYHMHLVVGDSDVMDVQVCGEVICGMGKLLETKSLFAHRAQTASSPLVVWTCPLWRCRQW